MRPRAALTAAVIAGACVITAWLVVYRLAGGSTLDTSLVALIAVGAFIVSLVIGVRIGQARRQRLKTGPQR